MNILIVITIDHPEKYIIDNIQAHNWKEHITPKNYKKDKQSDNK